MRSRDEHPNRPEAYGHYTLEATMIYDHYQGGAKEAMTWQ